jgi:transcriptional regulator with XRE-family HTH domain
MKIKDLKKKLLNNPEFRHSYFQRNLSLELAHQIVFERIQKNLTQADLARLAGTKQSGIARAESGKVVPTIDLLDRVATALGKRLEIEFADNSTVTFTVDEWAASNYLSPLQKRTVSDVNGADKTRLEIA